MTLEVFTNGVAFVVAVSVAFFEKQLVVRMSRIKKVKLVFIVQEYTTKRKLYLNIFLTAKVIRFAHVWNADDAGYTDFS
jgi:hypothetical protein